MRFRTVAVDADPIAQQMPTYQLANLDFGPDAAGRVFTVGPFTVRPVSNYDDARARLSAPATQSTPVVASPFGRAGLVGVPPTTTAASVGSNVVTATADCDDEGNALWAEPPLPGSDPEREIWDLCLIFSYLTSRRVFDPRDERRYRPNHHAEPVVSPGDIPEAARTIWNHRGALTPVRLVRPLWYLLHSNDAPDAEVKAAMASLALEIIVRVSGRPLPPSASDETLDATIQDLRAVVEQSGLSQTSKDAFLGVFGSWGSRGVHASFRRLAASYGLVPRQGGVDRRGP